VLYNLGISAFIGHFLVFFFLNFFDDILIFCKTRDEHLFHLHQVMKVLHQEKLLGLVISSKGMEPLPYKVKVIEEWSFPTTLHEIRSFQGFATFCKHF
jgi:hypothetical protein